MSMNTVPERLAALREAMKANGVDVYLIPVGDPHASEYMPDHYTALTYFSGFHGENSNFVVTMTESAVWADGRYFVQAEKEIAGTEIQLMRMGEPGVPTAEQYCGKVLPEGGKLGLCGLTASCGLVRSLQKELDRVLTPAAPPETISKEDFRKEIKNINDILKNPEEPAEKKGLLLRSIVDRIVYEKASGTMYFDFFVS